ncbi:hypothetical protein [Latilactobacillus sakei]|uniref:hypothetical protein n=1 Tax=Latilactobacillus sakei TaxID=1599 RepID=UPI0020C80A67|nr:hypothetical protein [Latilactobacillus sakei]MCP8851790.1 hypothetical protein [Latilactobacillus sakei]
MFDEQMMLRFSKKAYADRLDYIGVGNNDSSRFMWTDNKHIEVHIYEIFDGTWSNGFNKFFLIFAVEADKDCIVFKDLFEQTHNYEFEQIRTPKLQLSYLVKIGILTKGFISRINPNSLETKIGDESTFSSTFTRWAVDFANNEYTSSKSSLEKHNLIQSFPTLNKKLFIDKYRFNDMLEIIKDDQFTDEFNQCLFAYENEKWFLCAAGIGSTLEHLMLLTLTNYGTQKSLGRNPTAKDYLKAFTNKPILLDSRQQTYIDTLFRLRNSVDHHNSGYTSKGICDMLLDGVGSIFNEYYLESLSKSSN